VGSSRGRIGNTIVGTGFEGSFVPCAKAAPKKLEMPKLIVKNSIDARIVLPLSGARLDPSDPAPANDLATCELAIIN
jgi:hypothetical protein